MKWAAVLTVLLASAVSGGREGQSSGQPDWARVQEETLQHFQALLRLDTSNPPGNERLAVEYIKQLFDREGIPSDVRALDQSRSNLVARLKGTGRKRPVLIMG
ncbi:MAG TPA: hypothetical protein VFN38_11210, partial [Gemmatimonadaceae bacterium]|nr:hypothetical protein [Gemmatimonadaceae bacterium]